MTQEDRIRRALAAVDKLQRQLEQSERAKSEPIAIVGMACRFPGDSLTPERFWDLLARGGDAIAPVPPDRWDTHAVYDPDPETPGKSYLAAGGFLRDVDLFDADFFGISPREAESIDPQHRLLLETAWEALEDAGISTLHGKAAGVFTGICLNDYGSLQLNAADRTRITPYDGPGNAFCFASGRLSYFLGAHGPSLALDTACSSSLVAVHLACLSLRNGESEVALAGAVQLHLSPQTSVFLSRSKAMAADGRCKSFDASADGFGRGEGCGVVVLKRLSDALAAGDTIHAVIRGSAVNHDGRSSGLTVPNEAAQEKLIRQALRSAKLDPAAIDYIEAHGTGTVLGDPIEMAALQAVFGGSLTREQPLLVGSVKTNVGHLEAASGMAGLLKVVLALRNQQIPAHLHFRTPNPHIPWDRIPMQVPVEPRPWLRGVRPRLAGISSFGFSGTNAHLIVEEAPQPPVPALPDSATGILRISAKSEPALRELAVRYRDFLAETTESWATICHSARIGRAVFEHVLEVQSPSELDAYLEGRPIAVPEMAQLITACGPRVKLPTYPFQRRRYWVSAPAATSLAGKRLRKAGREIVFESELGLGEPAFTGEHRVFNRPVMPLAAFLLMAVEAAGDVLGTATLDLTDIEVREPAILTESATRLFQTILTPLPDGLWSFEIHSSTAQTWTLHVAGRAAKGQLRAPCTPAPPLPHTAVDAHYADFHRRGIDYGTSYRLIEALHAAGSRAQARIGKGAPVAMLDACFQSLAAAFPGLPPGDTFLPTGIRSLRLSGPFDGPLWCETEALVSEGRELSGRLGIYQSNGTLQAEVEGFTSRLVANGGDTFYVPVWQAQPTGDSRVIRSDRHIIFSRSFDMGPQDLREACEELLHLVRSLPDNTRLWIVTRGAQCIAAEQNNPWLAILWGLGRTIANERPELHCTCVDLDPTQDATLDLEAEQHAGSDEDQVAYRGGIRYVLRLERRPLPVTGPASGRLTSTHPGTLDALHFAPPADSKPAPGQIEIEVHAAGLNFKDVLYALGVVPIEGELPLGFECAGIDRATGDRVLSVLSPGCFAPTVHVDPTLVVKLPDTLSFAEAATLPVAFLTARYALETVARLSPGQRVLIHAAAGGVGQAAIQIARRAGAIIFATASRAKWDLLRSQGITHLYDSRSTAFASEILADTNGEGVDVVLNSLKGELAVAGLRALKPQGCFLEIGLSAPADPRCVPVQLGDVAPTVLRPLLQSIVDDVASGALQPLPREEFPLDQAPQAFHRMAQGKHTGKIVLTVPQAPRIQGTVLITGGLGALGLQVAEWLAAQGASHLILTSRSQPTLPVLPHLDAEVTVLPADIGDEASVRDLFAELRRQGIQLNGIVHAAGVIYDGILTRQQWPALEAVFAPKIQGAWNLHRHAEHLDFFVCFSSFAALYGSPGQGAYAAANAFLDALMHHRRAQGLPGLSLNWGPWAGPGMAANHMHHGVTPLPPAKALAALGALLRGTEETQAAIVDADWQSIGTRPVPSLLRGLVSAAPIRSEQHEATLQARLRDVPAGRQRAVLAEFLQSNVATVLRLDAKQPLQERKGFFDYGLDSLMAVELRNRLQNATGTALPTTLLFDCPHLEALTNYFEAALLTPPEQEEQEEDIEVLLARELALAEQEVRHG